MNDYTKVKLTVTPNDEIATDVLSALLAEIGFESFVNEEYGMAAYVPHALYDSAVLAETIENFPIEGYTITQESEFIEGEDWNAEWEKNYFQPIVLGDQCVIHSTFHKDVPAARYDILIDPKMAFGTGHHQTTYMMCRALLQNEESVKGKVVMDMGCGTAVLAILAAKMKASKVYGIDIDAVAAISAYDNARANRVGKIIETYCGDASLLQRNTYDVLLANINRNILLQDIPTYSHSLHRGGLLFVSGFYVEDMPMIIAMAQNSGLEYVSHDSIDNWCCIKFCKPEN